MQIRTPTHPNKVKTAMCCEYTGLKDNCEVWYYPEEKQQQLSCSSILSVFLKPQHLFNLFSFLKYFFKMIK